MSEEHIPDTGSGDQPGSSQIEGNNIPGGSQNGDSISGKGERIVREPLPADPPVIEDPVEILVQMAERGEIDPWNINIIEVTDRFLSELERCRQLNLRVSGRTLFYAATLLRMKSEHLAGDSTQDGVDADDGDEGFGDDFDLALDSEFEYAGRLGPIERLEREIQRRLDRKNLRKSPVTLFELIIELKNIEKEERRRRRLSESEPNLIDADDVVCIAHDEGYQDSATMVYEECLKCLTREEEMTLAELCRKLGWSIPEVYIPLLFLMLEGHCAMRQEEFFGDVFVQICRVSE
ncbi:MAG: segregation/condensation protein A [Methanoregula sp.]|nr:segregation/condensation protein A [Methanoregula sp.]